MGVHELGPKSREGEIDLLPSKLWAPFLENRMAAANRPRSFVKNLKETQLVLKREQEARNVSMPSHLTSIGKASFQALKVMSLTVERAMGLEEMSLARR